MAMNCTDCSNYLWDVKTKPRNIGRGLTDSRSTGRMDHCIQLKCSLDYESLDVYFADFRSITNRRKMYTLQKFLAQKAATEAANWFATCIHVMQAKLKSDNGSDDDGYFYDVRKLFPSLVREFVKQSPPRWPGQENILHTLGLGNGVEYTFSVIPENDYKNRIVDLCTTYFCSGFTATCLTLESRGDPRGYQGREALSSKVEEVFEQRGVNTFFRGFEKAFGYGADCPVQKPEGKTRQGAVSSTKPSAGQAWLAHVLARSSADEPPVQKPTVNEQAAKIPKQQPVRFLIQCPSCKSATPPDAVTCPHCGCVKPGEMAIGDLKRHILKNDALSAVQMLRHLTPGLSLSDCIAAVDLLKSNPASFPESVSDLRSQFCG